MFAFEIVTFFGPDPAPGTAEISIGISLSPKVVTL